MLPAQETEELRFLGMAGHPATWVDEVGRDAGPWTRAGDLVIWEALVLGGPR